MSTILSRWSGPFGLVTATAAAAVLLSTCQPAADDSAAAVPVAGSCHLRHPAGGVLPDLACTPGALNLAVTEVSIGSTICKTGWTKTVRPPVSVTTRLKRQIDAAYGLPTTTKGELDHLVSLELGGAPDDPRNLWVEPGGIPNPKDAVENTLHRAVCIHQVTLAAAQKAIARDWITAEQSLGLARRDGSR